MGSPKRKIRLGKMGPMPGQREDRPDQSITSRIAKKNSERIMGRLRSLVKKKMENFFQDLIFFIASPARS
jgi:hypothetical protein